MKTLKIVLAIAVFLIVATRAPAQEIFNADKNIDLEKVNVLIKKDASLVDINDETRKTPLHYAAMIRFLFEKNFDLNQRTLSGKSVYNIAEEHSQSEVLKAIKELNGDTRPQRFPDLSGPYLGQKPPGVMPEIFAPGVISTEESEGSSGFMRNGMVFIFQRFINRECHTYIMTRKDNHWSEPAFIPFWKQLIHNGDFVILPDDKTMLYQVKQDRSGQLVSNIWEVKLEEDRWGSRSALPAPINTSYDESFASRTTHGKLYFFSNRPGGLGQFDLYMAEHLNSGYSQPINLKDLNTPFHEWDPYVAPDERFLIFCSTKPGGEGEDDFYISFRDSQNRWTTPMNMGKQINSQGSENRPYITNDGRFFFFTSTKRGNRDIYWVDAKIIEDLRQKEFK